jgi:hypothetical protein
MPGSNSISRRASSLTLAACGIAAALLLARESIGANLERACAVNDTPYLELCPPLRGTEQRSSELRSRISANPGDSIAYVELAVLQRPAGGSPLLNAAGRLAPANANVTALVATQALEKQDFPAAVGPLVTLVEYGHNDKAALVLARLIVSGQGQLLVPHVAPGTKWLERVLARVNSAGGPFSAALPLVVAGLDKGVLGPAELMPYVAKLKAAGAWGDAYSLWIALHEGPSPTLYNAGFDRPFEDNGFDWEVTAQQPMGRAGALVGRSPDDQRGALLDIRFTGRPFAVPLVRQYVFLAPGRYRLRGDYKAAQLRMEQGLAWTVHCTSSPQTATSAGLGDTPSGWQQFQFEFAIPPDCGSVASLQLETLAPFEATVGSRGHASFDALSLEKLER